MKKITKSKTALFDIYPLLSILLFVLVLSMPWMETFAGEITGKDGELEILLEVNHGAYTVVNHNGNFLINISGHNFLQKINDDGSLSDSDVPQYSDLATEYTDKIIKSNSGDIYELDDNNQFVNLGYFPDAKDGLRIGTSDVRVFCFPSGNFEFTGSLDPVPGPPELINNARIGYDETTGDVWMVGNDADNNALFYKWTGVEAGNASYELVGQIDAPTGGAEQEVTITDIFCKNGMISVALIPHTVNSSYTTRTGEVQILEINSTGGSYSIDQVWADDINNYCDINAKINDYSVVSDDNGGYKYAFTSNGAGKTWIVGEFIPPSLLGDVPDGIEEENYSETLSFDQEIEVVDVFLEGLGNPPGWWSQLQADQLALSFVLPPNYEGEKDFKIYYLKNSGIVDSIETIFTVINTPANLPGEYIDGEEETFYTASLFFDEVAEVNSISGLPDGIEWTQSGNEVALNGDIPQAVEGDFALLIEVQDGSLTFVIEKTLHINNPAPLLVGDFDTGYEEMEYVCTLDFNENIAISSVEGLPEGLEASYTATSITLSGTISPDVQGDFEISIQGLDGENAFTIEKMLVVENPEPSLVFCEAIMHVGSAAIGTIINFEVSENVEILGFEGLPDFVGVPEQTYNSGNEYGYYAFPVDTLEAIIGVYPFDIVCQDGENTVYLECILDVILAVNENSTKLAWQFYPNPANSLITISYADYLSEKQATISLLSLQGRSLIQKVICSEKAEMDVSGLAVGIYLLQLETEFGVVVRKVFIQ